MTVPTPPLTLELTVGLIPTDTPNRLAVAADTRTGGALGSDNTPETLRVRLAIARESARATDLAAGRNLGARTNLDDPVGVVLTAEGALDLHRKLEGALRTAGVTIPPHPLDGHEERDAAHAAAVGKARRDGVEQGVQAAAAQLRLGYPTDELGRAAIEYVQGLDRVATAAGVRERADDDDPAADEPELPLGARAVDVPGQRWLGFQREHDGSLPLATAVHQAIGAASVCWDDLAGAGVFRDDLARSIADDLLALVLDRGARDDYAVAPQLDDVERPAATEGTWADNLEHLPAALVGTLTALLQDQDEATHRVGALAAARATLGDVSAGELIDAARFVSTGMTPTEED